MEYTKEFYQCVIRVIDYIKQGHRSVYCDKGEELAGNYWPDVVKLFREKKAVTVDEGGDIFLTQGHYLNPLYESSKDHIKEIERARRYKVIDVLGILIAAVCGIGGLVSSSCSSRSLENRLNQLELRLSQMEQKVSKTEQMDSCRLRYQLHKIPEHFDKKNPHANQPHGNDKKYHDNH